MIKEKIKIIKEKMLIYFDKIKNFIIKIFRTAKKIITSFFTKLLLILIALCFITGNMVELSKSDSEAKVISIVIEEELSKIQELYTYKYEYTDQEKIIDPITIFGWDVPFSIKEIDITFSGVVEVGYDISGMWFYDIPATNTVVLNIPEQIIKHYILQNTIKCEEHNNLINPIRADDVSKHLAKIEPEKIKRAKEMGVCAKAEERLREIVINHFDKLGYKVCFVGDKSAKSDGISSK